MALVRSAVVGKVDDCRAGPGFSEWQFGRTCDWRRNHHCKYPPTAWEGIPSQWRNPAPSPLHYAWAADSSCRSRIASLRPRQALKLRQGWARLFR